MDAIEWKEFEPCSNMLPHTDGAVLDDEVVIIHSFGAVGEPKVFEPYTGVSFSGVSSDVGGWSKALWERRSLDVTTKGSWPRAIQAGALVVWSAAMPGVRVLALLDGQARTRAACSHHHSMDVIIVPGMASIVDDAASITVWPKAFAHQWSVWSRRWVGLWCSHGLLPHPRQQQW